MKRINRTKLSLAIVSICFIATAVATTKTQQLHHVMHSISSLKKNITHSHRQRSQLQHQLQKTETATGVATTKFHTTTKQLLREHKILLQLNRDNRYYNSKLTNQKNILAKQVSATYILSRQPYIKVILSNKSPNKLNRMLTYYRFLRHARAKTITELRTTLASLHENKTATIKQTYKLRLLRERQKKELQNLKYLHHRRLHLLRKINKQLNTQKSRLNQLLHDKKSLETIIAKLRSTSTVFATPLSRLHHKLHWPAHGHIINLYGKQIAHSQLRWNGVLIKARQGTPVQAIATGRVVFAQWLQGYGLLLIIDHGHGFMSLYARNNSLYKKVGETVQRGTTIATIGNSGGYKNSELYFAIRHNGQPVNPKLWCRT